MQKSDMVFPTLTETEKEKPVRVAAYARVSTDKSDQINSLESQKKYFMEKIERQEDWELAGIYYDEGVSGTQTKKRQGFNRMIKDAMGGKFHIIITKEVSRFARNTIDTLWYTRQLRDAGVGVIFVIDGIDTREPDSEVRLAIMATIAQDESRKTSNRVKWGQQRRMEQGVVFGRELLGYHVAGGKLFVNEQEAQVVQNIFHKYTVQGKGTTVIARELMEEGVSSKKNAVWSASVILRILRNEKYVGDLCQKKTYTPDYLTHKRKKNRGEESKVYLENHHEAIIDRDLWNRTQKELERRSVMSERKSRYGNRYWCSGKIRCGECGCSFVSRKRKMKTCTYQTWRCYRAASHGARKKEDGGTSVGCDNVSLNNRALLFCMKYCLRYLCSECEEWKQEAFEQGEEREEVYRRMLDRIDVYRSEEKECRLLDIWLKDVPFGIHLKIKSAGRGENYHTDILETEFV